MEEPTVRVIVAPPPPPLPGELVEEFEDLCEARTAAAPPPPATAAISRIHLAEL